MVEKLTFRIKALTPIWTGNAERKCRTLRETGIIGSLRWWYEALARGLDKYACDPTNTKCEGKNHCVVCELFGCTGWARRFTLNIKTREEKYAPFVIAKTAEDAKQYFLGYYDGRGNEYEKNGGLLGEYELTFLVEEDKADIIRMLMKLACSWGIGAGTQKGFGIAEVEEIKIGKDGNEKAENIEFSEDKISSEINKIDYEPKDQDDRFFPKLNQFFFYKVAIENGSIDEIKKLVGKNVYKTNTDLKNKKPLGDIFLIYSYIPTSPWVRRAIRDIFRNDDVKRHLMMGFVSMRGTPKPICLTCWKHSITQDKYNYDKYYYCRECGKKNIKEKDMLSKTASKIFVSHIYNKDSNADSDSKWEMKIWGQLPYLNGRKTIKELLSNRFEDIQAFLDGIFNGSQNANSNALSIKAEIIWGEWDVDPKIILKSKGEFYGEQDF